MYQSSNFLNLRCLLLLEISFQSDAPCTAPALRSPIPLSFNALLCQAFSPQTAIVNIPSESLHGLVTYIKIAVSVSQFLSPSRDIILCSTPFGPFPFRVVHRRWLFTWPKIHPVPNYGFFAFANMPQRIVEKEQSDISRRGVVEKPMAFCLIDDLFRVPAAFMQLPYLMIPAVRPSLTVLFWSDLV